MTHTQEIIDLLIEAYGVKKQTDHLSYEAEAIRKMMRPELVQIGHMNPGRWRHIAGVYQKLGILDADVSLEGFLYDPGSQNHFPWLNRTFFAAIFVIVLLAIGTGFLFVFNRKLRWEIHERKQADEEIIRRELTLNKIFDVLPIGLWFTDKNGRLLRGNAGGVAHVISTTCWG
jgi:PAS domain-containing protein